MNKAGRADPAVCGNEGLGGARLKSWVEISRARLAGNFLAVRGVVGEDVEVLAVVKANAYGHGLRVCAPVLVDAGANWLGVSDVAEGAVVREALGGRAARVMVMCGMEVADAAQIVALDLTPVIWTVAQVQALREAAKAAGVCVAVHVEVDTGMARQGAAVGVDLRAVLLAVRDSGWVRCEGLMTHLCCSEVAGARTTAVAMEMFEAALGQVREAELMVEYLHVANTSAADEGSTGQWMRELARSCGARSCGARVMVRPGFAMYGHCLPVEGGVGSLDVLPVMTWKTRVIGVREIGAGATVGYEATFVAADAMTLALLQVGYADGFTRAASSGIGDGWVMIAGRRAMVVGRVSMNLTVVDVTGMGVSVGDEVVLLGEGVSAEDHARWSGTIAYDVLCGVKAGSWR